MLFRSPAPRRPRRTSARSGAAPSGPSPDAGLARQTLADLLDALDLAARRETLVEALPAEVRYQIAPAVEAALASRTEHDYLATQGIVGGEELRTMPLLLRSRRRLAWLSVNIILNIIAASVIAWYQDTLASVIALAVFLPIISDMSGCSGNQAVAVSMRELSLGLVRPTEALRVWRQEIGVGLANGFALGSLVALGGWL